jgi:hypothetical protein
MTDKLSTWSTTADSAKNLSMRIIEELLHYSSLESATANLSQQALEFASKIVSFTKAESCEDLYSGLISYLILTEEKWQWKASHLFEELVARFKAERPVVPTAYLGAGELGLKRLHRLNSKNKIVFCFGDTPARLVNRFPENLVTIGSNPRDSFYLGEDTANITSLGALYSLALHLICEVFEPSDLNRLLDQSYWQKIVSTSLQAAKLTANSDYFREQLTLS